jgi:murein DD-endopeptidase MepM/ murein hydrolase activator NlpD
MKYMRPQNQASGSARVPAVSPVPPVPEFRQVVGTFEPRQTITHALKEQGLSAELINQIIVAARPEYNLARVRAGQNYWICFTREGIFRDFRYPVDDERYLTVFHDVGQGRLVPVMKSFPYETRVEPISAIIESSLFLTIRDIGEMDQLALDLADIFGSDIDFYTDIQKGDSFKVLIEKKYLDGQFTKYGEILAAAFKNDRKMLTGFRFEDENGKPAFYAPDGRALKRSFLKSPLRFTRISSRFSPARLHPITRTVRPHLGVDYAAPMGTPVQAVGAGMVTSAGFSGNNGRMVRILHAGGFETMYLHLSRIAVRSGARVSQGQVIGYVGSSGLSTGPHLDFRVLRHGKAINPLKVIFPPGAPIPRSEFESFAALRDKLNNELRITDYE